LELKDKSNMRHRPCDSRSHQPNTGEASVLFKHLRTKERTLVHPRDSPLLSKLLSGKCDSSSGLSLTHLYNGCLWATSSEGRASHTQSS